MKKNDIPPSEARGGMGLLPLWPPLRPPGLAALRVALGVVLGEVKPIPPRASLGGISFFFIKAYPRCDESDNLFFRPSHLGCEGLIDI